MNETANIEECDAPFVITFNGIPTSQESNLKDISFEDNSKTNQFYNNNSNDRSVQESGQPLHTSSTLFIEEITNFVMVIQTSTLKYTQ